MTDLMAIDKVKQDEEQFITDLIETKGENLPAEIGDIVQVFEFTDWKAKAWKSLADKMSRLEDQTEAYNSALRSGQQWGIAALYSQRRMGEITQDVNPEPNPREYESPQGDLRKKEHNDGPKAGLSRTIWKDAERIANNPEVLDRVIESSKKAGDIPTKGAVLNVIRMENAKKHAAEKKEKQDEKMDRQKPKIVSEHFEWVKLSKNHLDMVIAGAKRGKFDPASKNFVIKKHDELRELMKQIEEAIG